MKTLNINLSNNSYNIYIDNNLLPNISSLIKEVYNGKKIYIITDQNVYNFHFDKLNNVLNKDFIIEYIIIPSGEEYKNIDTYKYICEELIKKNLRRNELIIGFGGGVVGDIAAFVASTIYRGVYFINIPTTLLSMVDSSIGGKTGIDFLEMKNILGTFFQPKLVLINLDFLNTLPKIEYISGMGELIKHSFIGNKDLYNDLLNCNDIDEDIIYKSLNVKKKFVMEDEFDQGVRMFLNFGHTFGHVIELKDKLKHGIAVANGMVMAIKFGIDLNITPNYLYDDLIKILKKYNFEIKDYEYKSYLKETVKDKKNLQGKIHFVLLKDYEKPISYEIFENEI